MNYHTLSDFRMLLAQGVAALVDAGLVALDTLAQDGLRVRACAGAGSFRRRKRLEQLHAAAQEHVARLRAELEVDPAAGNRRERAAQQRAAWEREEMSRLDRKFCIAPMMEWTDRHCRYFHRLLTREARIYTEMITTAAVLRGDRARLLACHPAEHPVALQLGGSCPADLAECARIAVDFGYDEVNLNVGCPSDRVQEGRFGACLMAEPLLVGECVAAMKAKVKVPVTVKCRIGIDDQDPEQSLEALMCSVKEAGVDALIVHARKAWLNGLSPRENRDIPPLDYDRVYSLKASHPDMVIVLNGGIADLNEAGTHLEQVDGVMMGRAAYQEPWRLLAVDPMLFATRARSESPITAARALIPYVESELARGTRLHAITRHMLGLFRGTPGARAFRRHLATEGVKPGAGIGTLCDALGFVAVSETRSAAA
jgi:tRNA-dihydrouridine synthase A